MQQVGGKVMRWAHASLHPAELVVCMQKEQPAGVGGWRRGQVRDVTGQSVARQVTKS
jgi:hypothetical protein